MNGVQGQFQIIILEAESQANSHSISGAWGKDITSSTPSDLSMTLSDALPVRNLPRANEIEVDPETLKSTNK